MLSTRQQQVLESLIEEYVLSAHPVGSRTLVSRYLRDVSSATVRNELMWLEGRGYVLSPHTSAGRVPTNDGYRSFVNHLLLRFEHLTSAPLQSKNSGEWLETLETPNLASSVVAASLTDVLERTADLSGCLAMYWLPGLHGMILHRGLAKLLSQPEFLTTDSALPLIQLLEDEGELANVLRDIQKESGLHIRIGTENRDPQLYAFSMLALRLERDVTCGVVACFGPTRMSYRKSIRAILTAADEISAMMNPDRRSRFEY